MAIFLFVLLCWCLSSNSELEQALEDVKEIISRDCGHCSDGEMRDAPCQYGEQCNTADAIEKIDEVLGE